MFINALTSFRHLSLFEPALSSPYTNIPPVEIHPIIFHPFTRRFPQWSPTLTFPHQDPIHTNISSPLRTTRRAISFFSILSPAQYWERSTNHSVPRYVIPPFPPSSSLLGPNILLNTIFSNTLRCFPPANVNDQILVLYILIFKFLDSSGNDNTVT